MIKKIIGIVVILSLIFAIPIQTWADEDEEETNEQEVREDILQVSGEASTEPQTQARAVLVLDSKSNQVIYEKNGYTKRAMASTTKIMTAIVVLEHAKLTDTVEISKKAGWTGGSRLGLKAGEKISVNDLLYGLMLRSRKRQCSSISRTGRRECRRICPINESKGKRIKSTKYQLCNPTWIRLKRALYQCL